MIYVKNDNVNPGLNHAIEEYFMKETDDDVFMLWRNDLTVLLGKNQYTRAEIDVDTAEERGVKVIRRLSGGGTVYCDLGNMQYSFITNTDKGNVESSFEEFAKPVVEGLKNLGLNAKFTGRNDILIDDKKVSGNAQYRHGKRIIHHGTLLFDVDVENLTAVLNSRPIKFINKNVKSVKSRIGTIKEYDIGMDVEEFMDYLSDFIIKYHGITDVRELDQEILDGSQKYLERWEDRDWNYGRDYDNFIERAVRHPFGLVDYMMVLDGNKIKEISILGDFFEIQDVEDFSKELKGLELSEEALTKKLAELPVSDYISGMENQDLIEDLLAILEDRDLGNIEE